MINKKDNLFIISDKPGNNLRLANKYKRLWVEESIDIDNSSNAKFTTSHTNNYLGASISTKSLQKFLMIVLIGLGIISIRLAYLQIFKGSYYRNLAEENRIRLVPVPGERGIIYDRFNKILVQNAPSFSLVLIPQDLPRKNPEREVVIEHAAEISGLTSDDIKQTLKKFGPFSYESITIKENLDYQTALALYLQNSNLPGVSIESGSLRNYRSSIASSTFNTPLSLSPVLGYLGKIKENELDMLREKGYLFSDYIGRIGIEKSYEPYLRGTYGKKKIEVNAVGKEQDILAVEAPKPGKNLVTTIDLEGQIKLEELVQETAEKTGNRKIAALAINPNNGEIIAMVSWPTFDNNTFSHGISKKMYQSYLQDKDRPLFNRVISGTYPPGSTAKLIVSAAALEEKVVTKNTTVNSVGGVNVGGKLFKDWKEGGHGITNVTKAIAWSVNTFFYYVGGGHNNFTGLGVDRIVRYMLSFNVSQFTNIDLPGENSGFLPSKEWKKKQKGESWFVGDTYNLSIGQGDLLVTPLQVAVWTSAVANGGTIITPHLGQKIIDPVEKTTTELSFTKKQNNLVSLKNLQIVQEGMRDCALHGSCKLLGTLPFEAAGKTGTAQWSKNHNTHAWFTSFAPYKNPQIVVTVLVEESGEGSVVAMPIAKKFLEWWGKKYL